MKTVSEARRSGFKWACIYDDECVELWRDKPEFDTCDVDGRELDVVCIIGASEYIPDNLIDLMSENASKKGYDFVLGATDTQIKNFEKSVKDLADFTFNVK